MEARRPNKRSLGSRSVGGGVLSLVDVMANSLTVLILLIILSMKFSQELKEKEKEDLGQFSLLMSKDLAKDVVANAMPTSAPALLHDYNNSPLDANPREDIMPILEMHREYVRLYYSNQVISHDDLLKSENALVEYIRSLSPIQRLRVRMDVYSIHLYYLVLSTLAEEGININHWHFLGYSEKQPPPSKPNNQKRPENQPQGDGSEIKEFKPDSDPFKDAPPSLPQGAVPSIPGISGDTGSSREEADDSLENGDSSGSDSGDFNGKADGQAGDFGGEGSEEGDNGDSSASGNAMDEKLSDILSQLTDEELAQLYEYFGGFSVSPDSPDLPEELNPPTLEDLKELLKNLPQSSKPLYDFSVPDTPRPRFSLPSPGGNPPEPLSILVSLIHYLVEEQDYYDLGQMSELNPEIVILNAVILQTNPELMQHQPFLPLALSIYNQVLGHFKSHHSKDAEGLTLSEGNAEFSEARNVVILKNKFPNQSKLTKKSGQAPFGVFDSSDSGNVMAEMILRRYPTFYGGEKIKLADDEMILAPPRIQENYANTWRLICILSKDLKNYRLGFIYAGLDENGSLIIPLEYNTLTLNNATPPQDQPINLSSTMIFVAVLSFLGTGLMVLLFIRVRTK